jgi:glycosyltransferase involved in cell wall biosynthesis/uridine kinase
MEASEYRSNRRLKNLASAHDLSLSLIRDYFQLFQKHGIPVFQEKKTKKATRIMMVSTHGYWGDPPPAGVPDTGGQTYYVLEVSKALAQQGRHIIILARWFKPYPRVENFAENLWLIRIKAGGDAFIRKEDIYPLLPEMAEASTAVSLLFGANLVMGHYADGMVGAVEVGERLRIPVVIVPHSLGILKVKNLGLDPRDPEVWHDPQYNFWIRESLELTALKGANFEIANTAEEPRALEATYGLERPHLIMPAGAGKDFFDAFDQTDKPKILFHFGLQSKEYLIYFGRLSEAKNIPAIVALLGEARKLEPAALNKVKLVIVGGNPGHPHQEEQVVKQQINRRMAEYGFSSQDVILLSNQKWPILSQLVRHSLFYVGMQLLEPFGMSAAEAMAAGAPVMISEAAGITNWLRHGENALIIDPHAPEEAAKILVQAVKDEHMTRRLSDLGHSLAKEKFSWSGIAKRQAEVMDSLHRDTAPAGMKAGQKNTGVFRKREDRAYHRAVFVWRGDIPEIKPKHKKAAMGLIPYIREAVIREKKKKRRLIAALGGESGVGKSEVAEFLRFALRREKIQAWTVAGDAFFKRIPSENHLARLKAYQAGKLDDYLGPQEVDLARLESILRLAKQRENRQLFIPSDCRRLHSKRYEHVPVDLSGTDVILVDLTYSLLLEGADLKVFFESDYKRRLEEIRRRNLGRDPDQDFAFILKVLEIEHRIIQDLRGEADLIVADDYEVSLN